VTPGCRSSGKHHTDPPGFAECRFFLYRHVRPGSHFLNTIVNNAGQHSPGFRIIGKPVLGLVCHFCETGVENSNPSGLKRLSFFGFRICIQCHLPGNRMIEQWFNGILKGHIDSCLKMVSPWHYQISIYRPVQGK
jgi:hypothetical protein